MNRSVRKRLFVDFRVQTALMLRVVFYWMFFLLTMTFMLFAWRAMNGQPQTFSSFVQELLTNFGAVLLASLVVLPLVVNDIIRLSNRFAGPIFRLRRVLRTALEGQPVEPIQIREFRKDDYWKDIAEDFNKLLRQLQEAGAGNGGVADGSMDNDESSENKEAQPVA